MDDVGRDREAVAHSRTTHQHGGNAAQGKGKGKRTECVCALSGSRAVAVTRMPFAIRGSASQTRPAVLHIDRPLIVRTPSGSAPAGSGGLPAEPFLGRSEKRSNDERSRPSVSPTRESDVPTSTGSSARCSVICGGQQRGGGRPTVQSPLSAARCGGKLWRWNVLQRAGVWPSAPDSVGMSISATSPTTSPHLHHTNTHTPPHTHTHTSIIEPIEYRKTAGKACGPRRTWTTRVW